MTCRPTPYPAIHLTRKRASDSAIGCKSLVSYLFDLILTSLLSKVFRPKLQRSQLPVSSLPPFTPNIDRTFAPGATPCVSHAVVPVPGPHPRSQMTLPCHPHSPSRPPPHALRGVSTPHKGTQPSLRVPLYPQRRDIHLILPPTPSLLHTPRCHPSPHPPSTRPSRTRDALSVSAPECATYHAIRCLPASCIGPITSSSQSRVRSVRSTPPSSQCVFSLVLSVRVLAEPYRVFLSTRLSSTPATRVRQRNNPAIGSVASAIITTGAAARSARLVFPVCVYPSPLLLSYRRTNVMTQTRRATATLFQRQFKQSASLSSPTSLPLSSTPLTWMAFPRSLDNPRPPRSLNKLVSPTDGAGVWAIVVLCRPRPS